MAPALGASRLVHALLEAGAKPTCASTRDGGTILPLHLATKSDDVHSVRLLSRSKADLNATGSNWIMESSTFQNTFEELLVQTVFPNSLLKTSVVSMKHPR